jgi:hypothetical protein
VDEEDYRYEEQKPRTKEAAIIMLADGTEAAVRALPNPTRRKIQGVIQEVFKQKIEDGQLDESDLTLADLRKIREAFDVTLRGMLGHRIRYPGPAEQQPRLAASAGTQPSAAIPGETVRESTGSASGQAGGRAPSAVPLSGSGGAGTGPAGVGPGIEAPSAIVAGRPRIPPSAAALRARRSAAARAAAASERRPSSSDEQDPGPDDTTS